MKIGACSAPLKGGRAPLCPLAPPPTVIILNFILLNIFITPVKLIYKKYKTLTKKESLIR